MWDFTNAGAADPNWVKADFGPRRLMDLRTIYSLGFWFRRTRTWVIGPESMIIGEDDDTQLFGIGFKIILTGASGDRLQFIHNQIVSAQSPAIAINTTYSYFVTWDTVNGLIIYRNGVNWHADAAFVQVPSVPAGIRTVIGADPSVTRRGPPGQVGNIAIWPGIQQFPRDAVIWHGGIMPNKGSMLFFYRCIELPGKDEYIRQIPDCYGFNLTTIAKRPVDFYDNVSLYIDPSDDYYNLHGETIHSGMQTITSEELHRRRLVKKSYQITVPIEFLAKELGEDLQLTHKGGLECAGEGFGYGDAPRRLVRIEGMALDPEDGTIGLTLHDIKRYAVSYYNSFRAPYTITGRQLGVFQLIPTYTAKETIRTNNSFGKDIGGIYQKFGRNQEPLTGDGLLVESRKRNYIANAAFKWEFSSWNTVDPGTGTITAEAPAVEAIDASITEYAIKLTTGSAWAGNTVGLWQQAAAGPGVGTDLTFSYIRYNETANGLRILISRTSDGQYLQTLTGVWGVPATVLYPPLDTSYKEPSRYVLPYTFDGNDTYIVEFYSAEIDSAIHWLYQAQLEEGKFATGPVIGESGSGITRQGSVVQLRNPDGLLLPKAHGTVAFEFEPLWDHDESSGTKYICRLEHDAGNYIEIHWDGTDLVARFRYNAVNQDSSLLAPTWNAGDALKIGIRWLAAGELGKASAQGQLFAKVGSGAWQEVIAVEFTQVLQALAESIFYIGSHGGAIDEHNAADGHFRYLHCFPEALPFEEIQALLGEPA